MQCLASLELLWAYMAQNSVGKSQGQLTRAFRGVVSGMRAGQRVSPRGLFSEIARQAPRFKGFQQQDSQELLRYMVDAMAEEEIKLLKRGAATTDEDTSEPVVATETAPAVAGEEKSWSLKPPQTFLHGVFGGSLASLVTCCTCFSDSVTVDPCFDVSLPIPGGSTGPTHMRGPKASAASSTKRTKAHNPAVGASINTTSSKSSSAELRAQRALLALRKMLKDGPAAQAIVDNKRKYKTLPAEDCVPKPDGAWCRKASKRDCIVWLLSFARPQSVDDFQLLGYPLARLTKSKAREHLLAHKPIAAASTQQRWLAADNDAAHGELHRWVESLSAPLVQRALQRGAHAVEAWALQTQKLAHDIAHASVVAVKRHMDRLAAPCDPSVVGAAAGSQPATSTTTGRAGQRSQLQADGSLQVGKWTFPPAFAVAGAPPIAWPGTDPAMSSSAKERPPGTLRACLAAFTQPERLTRKQGNAYRCLKCGQRAAEELLEERQGDEAAGKHAQQLREDGVKRDACKRMCFFQAPLVLTLHLNRFKQTASGRFVKNGAHVSFKRTLRMDKYFAMHADADDKGPFLYELSGVVVHGGGMGGGHYIAYTRSSSGWAYASDSSTSSAPEAKVLGQQAYILFYTRVNPDASQHSAAATATM